MIHPSGEYGIVLMAWTILHLKGKFGMKQIQKLEIYTEAMSALNLWPSLLEMCQSSAVKVNLFIFRIISFNFYCNKNSSMLLTCYF